MEEYKVLKKEKDELWAIVAEQVWAAFADMDSKLVYELVDGYTLSYCDDTLEELGIILNGKEEGSQKAFTLWEKNACSLADYLESGQYVVECIVDDIVEYILNEMED